MNLHYFCPHRIHSNVRFSLLSLPFHWLVALWFGLIVLAGNGPQAQAQFFDWTNITNNNSYFDIDGNWSTGSAPGANDAAFFSTGTNNVYEVWWDSTTANLTPAVGRLFVIDDNVKFRNVGGPQHLFTINGSGGSGTIDDFIVSGGLSIEGIHVRNLGGARIDSGGTLLIQGSHASGSQLSVQGIGFRVDGSLDIYDGGVVNNTTGNIGFTAGIQAAAKVSGGGSRWDNSGDLYVGNGGDGYLSIEAGGTVANDVGRIGFQSGSNGVVDIFNALWNNSGNFVVGDSGKGTLRINDGGVVNNVDGYIGYHAGSEGSTNVSTASWWINSGELRVGRAGVGKLTVDTGGIVRSTSSFVGDLSGSMGEVEVVGADSQWNNSGGLTIGRAGVGKLTVDNGGIVRSERAFVGDQNGSMGEVEIAGTGSQWNISETLEVGSSGSGSLVIRDGGTVNNTVGFIARNNGSAGTVMVTGAGSRWNNSAWLVASGLSSPNGDSGTLTISDGGQVAVGDSTPTGSGTWLSVSGDSGSNRPFLTIEKGHSVINAGNTYIGYGDGSWGRVAVAGSDSQLINDGDLFVGFSGNGELEVLNGGVASAGNILVGRWAGSSGRVRVSDNGSQLNAGSRLDVGLPESSSTLDVENGGVVNAESTFIRFFGTANVTGENSALNSSSYLGLSDSGTLNLTDNGRVNVGNDPFTGSGTALTVSGVDELTAYMDITNATNATVNNDGLGLIGLSAGMSGTARVFSGGQWINTGNLAVGISGKGLLVIGSGGEVSNAFGRLAFNSGSTGSASVAGTWNNANNLAVGVSGTATLNVQSGGVVNNVFGNIGFNSGSTGTATVHGVGSQWNNSSNLAVGVSGAGTLNVENGGVVNNVFGNIGFNSGSTGTATVNGVGSQWNNSSNLAVGVSGVGALNIENGGVVNNAEGQLGFHSGSSGTATVSGSGSRWNNSGNLFAGIRGNGAVQIESGGVVSNAIGNLGFYADSAGTATVTGSGSQWNNSNSLFVGISGNGTLNVASSGRVNSENGFVGYDAGSTGSVTVDGTGTQWNNSNDLIVGGSSTAPGGMATLNIYNNGLVTVGNTTRIWNTAAVNLDGGRFEFGQTTLTEFGRINATTGSLAGNINHGGFTDVGKLLPAQSPDVDLTGVMLVNTGTLYGNGSLGHLVNQSTGQLETTLGERLRFTAAGIINAGEINNFGGQIRFDQDVTNQSGGFVSGRGQFVANGGWTNDGVMAFSGGFADVHGDVNNSSTGVIAIGGNSTTTFYDDVTMDAANMNVEIASDSYGVFYGSYNGGSDGLGTLQAFGDLRPGNSPAVVSFGGDLEMGVNTATYIELGGLLNGEFDQLNVAGNFLVDGILDVSLINGFNLDFNQEFLIADIVGTRTGLFDGLDEGALVGNFVGRDLFISYRAGNGNDISLFTTVPEPSAALLGLIGLLSLVCPRSRRRSHGC